MSANPVGALTLTNRSIEVSTAQPSATASHTFEFVLPSTTTLGSIVFLYCENSPLISESCSAPPGLDVLSASLSGQTGNTGFSVDGASSTANKLVITRTAAAGAIITSRYIFDSITNPSTAGSTEFVRITTYASTDGSGSFTDNGTVAFATVSPFSVGANVPPFLQICVAITVAPDCTTSSGDRINLGTLSKSQVKAGTSQFTVGTNSISGYTVFAQGTTMTSGNNAISALASPTPSFPGNNQFGINLRNNSIPNVGSDPFGAGSGTPTADYDTPNLYKYSSGDSVAQSTLPSDYNRMTVSYVVNVNSSQPPGVYASTFTYLATATF
ncbi:hypothetical protein HY379_00430 [Candidatus Saccharibacteria bacterium]|nr:hypothetical protein [Candidatus Saccharibacteria bacterium]